MKTLLLSLALIAAAGAPAFAAEDVLEPMIGAAATQDLADQDFRVKAFQTDVPSLAPTAVEKRAVAIAYMDDALALLSLAKAHLRDAATVPGAHAMGLAELNAASGKATTAALELFHDPQEAAKVRPIALKLEAAAKVARRNPALAIALIDRDGPLLASVYQTELATMGGGAGTTPPAEED